MKEKYTFLLSGQPLASFRWGEASNRMWDTYNQQQCNHRIELKNQFQDEPLLTSPLDISLTFHILRDSNNHINNMSIINMVRSTNSIFSGIIYKKETLVRNIKARKIYSTIPHTEIIITPLKKEDNE